MSINFPTPSQLGQLFTDPLTGYQYTCDRLGPPAQWVSVGSATSLASTYLKIDATNDPVTGSLRIGSGITLDTGGKGTFGSGNIQLNADGSASYTGQVSADVISAYRNTSNDFFLTCVGGNNNGDRWSIKGNGIFLTNVGFTPGELNNATPGGTVTALYTNGEADYGGTVRVGGTPTSPNIALNADGSINAAGFDLASGSPQFQLGASGNVGTVGSLTLDNTAAFDGSNNRIYLSPLNTSDPDQDALFTIAGKIKVGGTSAVPNIALNADGSGRFTYKQTQVFDGTPGGDQLLTLTNNEVPFNGMYTGQRYALGANSTGIAGIYAVRTGAQATALSFLTGNTSNTESREVVRFDSDGDVLIGGTLPSAPNIALNADGTANISSTLVTGNATGSQFDGTLGVRQGASGFIDLFKSDSQNFLTCSKGGSVLLQVQSTGDFQIGGDLINGLANITLTASGQISAKNFNAYSADYWIRAGAATTTSVIGLTTGDLLIGGTLDGTFINTQLPNIHLKNGGTIEAVNTTIQPLSSERRLKENIVAIDADTAWETVKSTPYYAYNFIGNESTSYGPMADEVPTDMVVQPMVDDEDGNKVARADAEGPIRTYDNGMLQARLYTALQTALTRIEGLEAEVSSFKDQLSAL